MSIPRGINYTFTEGLYEDYDTILVQLKDKDFVRAAYDHNASLRFYIAMPANSPLDLSRAMKFFNIKISKRRDNMVGRYYCDNCGTLLYTVSQIGPGFSITKATKTWLQAQPHGSSEFCGIMIATILERNLRKIRI